jgi:hypothetical protein
MSNFLAYSDFERLRGQPAQRSMDRQAKTMMLSGIIQ